MAVFAGSAHQADQLDRLGPARLSALASILCAAGVFLLEALPTPLLFVFGGVLSLAGCAAFFLIYGKNLAFYNHQERICQLATAFVVGAAIVALTATLADTVAFLVTLSLFAALHLFTLKPNKDTFAFASLAEKRASHQFALSSLFTTALTGFVLGHRVLPSCRALTGGGGCAALLCPAYRRGRARVPGRPVHRQEAFGKLASALLRHRGLPRHRPAAVRAGLGAAAVRGLPVHDVFAGHPRMLFRHGRGGALQPDIALLGVRHQPCLLFLGRIRGLFGVRVGLLVRHAAPSSSPVSCRFCLSCGAATTCSRTATPAASRSPTW